MYFSAKSTSALDEKFFKELGANHSRGLNINEIGKKNKINQTNGEYENGKVQT